MFLTGLVLTVHEALVSGPERPSLYILYAGMMGLPFMWSSRPNRGHGEDEPE